MTTSGIYILPYVMAMCTLWSACWILILYRGIKLKTYVQPPLALGNVLGIEIVSLFYLHTIYPTFFFYASFLLWPAASLGNLVLMFLYWERKWIPYLLAWAVVSGAFFNWIFIYFNDAGTFTISMSISVFFVSLGHLYQLYRDTELRRHSWPIWGTRFVAASSDSILIYLFYPYGKTLFIIALRLSIFTMDCAYCFLFRKKLAAQL